MDEKAVQITTSEEELEDGVWDLTERINFYLNDFASHQGDDDEVFNGIFANICAEVVAIAIAMGVTPEAVVALLMQHVPDKESWPTEMLSPENNDE